MATINVSSTGIAVETYSGSTLLSTVALPGATAETPGNSFATRYVVSSWNGYSWTFQAQGIWYSSDRINWTLGFTPPGLTATNSARVGLLILTLQGTQYLCGAYNTTGNLWVLFKTSNGFNWDISPSFTLSTSNVGKLAVYGNRGYCYNFSGTFLDVRTLDWGNNLIYQKRVISSGTDARTADTVLVTGSATLTDNLYGVYYKTTVPRGLVLYEYALDNTFPIVITPSVDLDLDSTARPGIIYHPESDSIVALYRSGSSGLRGFKTNSTYTDFDAHTTGVVPSDLQTNTNTNIIQVENDPAYGVDPTWNIKVTATAMASYNYEDTSYYTRWEPLQLTGALSGTYMTVLKGVNSLGAYQSSYEDRDVIPGLQMGASIIGVATSSGFDGVGITYTFFCEKNQNFLLSVNYGEANTGTATTPITITSTSSGTINGNTISLGLTAGYTTLNLTWNILADSPLIQQAYQLSTNLSNNLPQEREDTAARLSIPYTF